MTWRLFMPNPEFHVQLSDLFAKNGGRKNTSFDQHRNHTKSEKGNDSSFKPDLLIANDYLSSMEKHKYRKSHVN